MSTNVHGRRVRGKNSNVSKKVVNPYAVAVMRRNTVVGHVPRKISAACSLFLHGNGTIRYRTRCFSGPCSAAYFPICSISAGVYSLYLPRPELPSSSARFMTVCFFNFFL